MPSLLNILRGGNGPEIKKYPDLAKKIYKKDPPASGGLSFPKNILTNSKPAVSRPPENAAVKMQETPDRNADELYERAINLVNILIHKSDQKEPLEGSMDKVYELIDNIFEEFSQSDSMLYMIYEKQDNSYYLPYHIVNILVLSSYIGIKIGYNRSSMRELALACIFCDIGMDAFREITERPAAFSAKDFELVKDHISRSLDIAGTINGIGDPVKSAIEMHHERADGSGYPRGINTGKICHYAKIIGLVDTYEALTHYRRHRDSKNAHTSVKFLLSSLKNIFDAEIMRIFINNLSIYPIGTTVELSTGDTARVVGVKSGSPLKPIVKIILDFKGMPCKENRIIDLSADDSISIRNPK